MRVVFMGTPEFAVPSFEALIKNHELVAAVTRPDAVKGRGHKLAFSPVKQTAIDNNIPVLQPARAKDDLFISQLSQYNADAFIVAAYGMILPEAVLRLPKIGSINVHASLLPKLRGAAPIQWSIINGDTTTGITIMHMARKLDAGDIITKTPLEIMPDDTAGSLHDKLSILGAQALIEAIDLLERGAATREPQNDAESTYAPMLTKAHGLINWHSSAKDIIRLVRGLNPWPVAYTHYASEPLKIWNARTIDGIGHPGEVMDITKDGFIVGTANGCVEVLELQARSAARMSASAYLRGHSLPKGTVLS